MHWPGSIDNEQSGSNGRSREHASILRSNNMIGGKENIKDGSSSALQYLEDRNKTAHSVQGPDQQVRNKRTSRRLSQPGTGPALRSSRLTDSGVSVTHTVDHCASNFSLDEGDRRIEQYQMELRQLQTEVPGPRTYQGGAKSPNISATRPRASADAGSSIPQASPSQQQLLTSLKEGGSSSTSSLQSMRPTSPRTRPTTPIRPPPPSPTTPIRPPPPSPTTPARPPHPSPSMSPSIVSTPVVVINGTYSPANNKKASLPNGRRVKPSPPVSSSLSPPTAPRPRAASVTTINSMNSKGNFNVEGGVHQAPPSVPLPSVPPQVSPAHQSVSYLSADDSLNHRHKKLTEASPGTLNAPPSSQFMSAELEEMALLSTLNSRTGMAAELEAVKRQLVEKEDIITRLTMEHQKQRQQQQEQQVQNSRVVADEVSSSKQEISNLEDVRSKLEKELASAVSEIQRLRQMREDQEHDQRNIRQELIILRTECATEREAYSVLEQELEAFKARSQEEQEVHSRDLQETVQRFTYQISQLEDQHSSEMQKLQRDHDELLEAMVLKHANALTDLSEQAKTDYESRLSRENLESVSREKVLKTRLEEQSAKNHCLEERLFKLEKGQEAHEEEKDAWRETNKSLERQLAMENLQQQENMYRIEKVEKENRRLRHILTDLDLAARLSSHSEGEECGSTEPRLNGENNSDNDNDNDNDNDQKKMVALYESQRQKWIEQTKLLERKMAKSEEEATAIMQKNMELMVALEMAQSSHGK
ncbi:hypothetical protein BGX28_003715 [Mortierella sp. GBA30]|nr:hypothetical protein BGX28_003715 [Mortierella sp. GBA30]